MKSLYNTEISKNNLNHIKSRNMTPSELIDFLENGAIYRSFPDVLRSVYPEEDLAQILREGLAAQSEQPLTSKEADSLRHTISNWMNGISVPQSREQLFRICFALSLDESQTSRVLASASETGIHYRDPKELVYAFALRTGLNYPEAVALNQEMESIYQPVVQAAEEERQKKWQKKEKIYHEKRLEAHRQHQKNAKRGGWAEPYLGPIEEAEEPNFLTQQVAHRFEQVADRDGLRQFFLDASADLGFIHESAYEKFWHLLLLLQEPDDPIAPNQDAEQAAAEVYSLERIARTYFRMNVPTGKKTGGYDYLQKAIKKNWPGSTELQKMKSRKIDVSRKALLLLFLITEDFLYSEDLQYSDRSDEDEAWFLLEEEDSPRDQLEIALKKANLFLETYGMNQLDPGNPFDCLILYAMAAEYGTEFLSDKFSAALEVLFSRITDK